MLTIIIPTCTDFLADRLLVSLKLSSPTLNCSIIVADNGLSAQARNRYPYVTFVDTPEPFCFARAVNNAATYAKPGSDLVLLNDDVIVKSDNFTSSLERMLNIAKVQGFGLISPIIEGGVGNPDQSQDIPAREIRLTRKPICFVAAVIPRPVWDALAGLEEGFPGYGFEDTDFNRRVVNAGWKLGCTGAATVQHGDEANAHSVTFFKKFGKEKYGQMYMEAKKAFEAKWGQGPQLGNYEKDTIG